MRLKLANQKPNKALSHFLFQITKMLTCVIPVGMTDLSLFETVLSFFFFIDLKDSFIL